MAAPSPASLQQRGHGQVLCSFKESLALINPNATTCIDEMQYSLIGLSAI